MLSLLRSELRRLTARRAARILAVALFGVMVLVEARIAAVSRSETRNVGASFTVDSEQAPRLCAAMQSNGDIPTDVDCSGPEAETAVRERFAAQTFEVDTRVHARTALPGAAQAVVVGVAVAAFLVGATYVGADWSAGTMQALLFWEPRRWRVLVAKALALVAVLVAFTAALQAVTYGLTYLVAATRGTTAGLTTGVQLATLLTMLRGMVVVSAAGLVGFGIAGLARVTAAALGAAFGYFVVLENLIRTLRPMWQRYLFTENVTAVMIKRTPIYERSATVEYLGGVRGAVTLVVYLALLLGAFYLSFERRDVT